MKMYFSTQSAFVMFVSFWDCGAWLAVFAPLSSCRVYPAFGCGLGLFFGVVCRAGYVSVFAMWGGFELFRELFRELFPELFREGFGEDLFELPCSRNLKL